jgi:hypothetical protein
MEGKEGKEGDRLPSHKRKAQLYSYIMTSKIGAKLRLAFALWLYGTIPVHNLHGKLLL